MILLEFKIIEELSFVLSVSTISKFLFLKFFMIFNVKFLIEIFSQDPTLYTPNIGFFKIKKISLHKSSMYKNSLIGRPFLILTKFYSPI